MSFRSFAYASLFLGLMVRCSSSDSGSSGGDTDSGSTTDTNTVGDSNKPDTTTGGDTTGGGDTTPGGDTTSGGDTTTPPGDGGVTCGSTTCDKGQVCCATPVDGGSPTFTCATDCPDGSVSIACTGGSSCGGSTPYCCGTVTLDPSTPPCGFSAGSASCTSTCQTDIPLACSGEHKARLCDKKSDCADDTGYTNCCTFSAGGTSGTICASDTMAALGGGTCL